MSLAHRTTPLARTAAGGVLALTAMSLAACGDTAGPETGTDVQDIQEAADDGPYEGPYDRSFSEDLDSYQDEEVTVSADVAEVLSPSSFVIAGTDDTAVEPLLVVGATEVTGLEPDLTVAVTGTVDETFVLAEVEEELGVDLDDALYTAYDQEPYLKATGVDTSVASDQ